MAKVNKQSFFTYASLDNHKKNWFDLSHTNSGSCNMGILYPVLCTPTLPGDYHVLKLSYLLRMAQMVAPPMTRIGVSFFAFDVPNRILMNPRKWDKFLSDIEGDSGVSLPTVNISDFINDMSVHLTSKFNQSSWRDNLKDNLNALYRSDFSVDYDIVEEVAYGSTTSLSIALTNNVTSSNINSVNSWLWGKLYKDFLSFYPYKGTLMDYLGFPVVSPAFNTNALLVSEPATSSYGIFKVHIANDDSYAPVQVLPFLAYLFIWNEYFRQEFIQQEIPAEMLEDFASWYNDLGSIGMINLLKRRCWEHDYLTSCLPSPQLGDSAAIAIGEDGQFTIPELREANLIQRIKEKLLHGGTRIFEILRNFFGENVSDARLQIPQFIKGSHHWLKISDIYQTAPGASDSLPTLSPDSNIAAPRGASVNAQNYGLTFKHKSKEHGYLIVLMNIQPESVYSQGFPRHFFAVDTLDYGWPDFANITEQPVYNREVFATRNNLDTHSGSIFGWQSQYAWYKYLNSEIHGELRDDLDFFHFGRLFETAPLLNASFLECNPTDRPFPIEYEYDKLTYHLAFDYSVERRLPYYGIPSLR